MVSWNCLTDGKKYHLLLSYSRIETTPSSYFILHKWDGWSKLADQWYIILLLFYQGILKRKPAVWPRGLF
jgi:hypothetical protein